MRRHFGWGLVAVLAGCEARIDGATPLLEDAGSVGMGETDGAPDAPLALGAWSTPARVTQAATRATEDDVTLSSNALEMIFAIAGTNGKDLYYTSRKSLTDDWTSPMTLAIDTPGASEESPRLSADDLTLYFASDSAGNGTLDIYAATRADTTGPTWSKPAPLTDVNTDGLIEKWFAPCDGGHYVVVQGLATADTDLFEGVRGGVPMLIPQLSSPSNDTGAFLTRDCLTIFFASNRSGMSAIYTAHRDHIDDPWPAASPVTDFAIPGGNGNQEDPWLSPDGHTFAFASDATGTKDVYLSTR
jgi:hypothetical protein